MGLGFEIQVYSGELGFRAGLQACFMSGSEIMSRHAHLVQGGSSKSIGLQDPI